MAGCNSCESVDGSTFDPCESRSCRPGATCDNGRCECDDPALIVGPQFCVNTQFSDTWVTYDVTPLSDTMLVAFDGEQWRNVDWESLPEGHRPAISFPGWSYSRAGLNSLGAGVSLSRSRNNPDTLGIFPIMRKRERYHFIEGCCGCQGQFKGVIVDENTIEGYVTASACGRPGPGGYPPEVFIRYPMTWHRMN